VHVCFVQLEDIFTKMAHNR